MYQPRRAPNGVAGAQGARGDANAGEDLSQYAPAKAPASHSYYAHGGYAPAQQLPQSPQMRPLHQQHQQQPFYSNPYSPTQHAQTAQPPAPSAFPLSPTPSATPSPQVPPALQNITPYSLQPPHHQTQHSQPTPDQHAYSRGGQLPGSPEQTIAQHPYAGSNPYAFSQQQHQHHQHHQHQSQFQQQPQIPQDFQQPQQFLSHQYANGQTQGFQQMPAPQHHHSSQMQQPIPQPIPQPMQPQMQQQGSMSFPGTGGLGAMPGMGVMLAGMAQQLGTAAGGQAAGNASVAAALAPQLMQNLGVPAYFSSVMSNGSISPDSNTFMRVPKHYFAVNHAYVLKKLALLLMPFQRRSWARRHGVDQRAFERQGTDAATSYLPPRDDLNAPDLYIPVMAFVSYVLLVGFVFGTRGSFTAEILAKYFSKGFAVLTLEVLIIKLGMYLISARPTPWLDVIAYRGYKFVGVMVAMIADLLFPRLYYPVFFYTAFSMAIFLMRSHRRIILPRETEQQSSADLPQRNAFLLFVCALQFPIYWLLILDVRAFK